MVRLTTIALSSAALACLLLPAAALDLTPAPGFRELEGFKIPVTYFADGSQTVIFQPPAGWSASGGGTRVFFFPKDRPDALMQLRVVALKASDLNAPEDLEKWCRSLLPQDATEVTLDGETVGAFTLRALPSREHTYTYAAQGRRFTTSVAIVDLTVRERFALLISARSTDFKATRETVIRSMFSFSWRN